MRKKLYFFLTLFLLSQMIFSQNEGKIWYFGGNAGLDFNSGIPISLSGGQLNSNEGTAVISDSNGRLLFYTDGVTVWNRNHVVMPNGNGLLGSPSSSQAAIIIPKPESPFIYYIFTCEESGNANGFRYSEVDMSLEGGKGDVSNVKNILLTTPVSEKITAVKKTDDSGYWVITHSFQSNNFLAYSVTSSGVNLVPVISSIGLPVTESTQTVGHLKVSPDGTKLISCSFKQKLELFDFDALTGVVSNPQVLNDKRANYGAEFSPSGKVLYVTTGNDSYIYDLVQYDLTAANIATSEINLKTNFLYQFGAVQLGPDGKIYTTITNSDYVSYIDQPEIVGNGCNFIKNGIFLGGGHCTFGLPQFVQSYFKSSSVVQLACLGSEIEFGFPSELNVSSVVWDFGDGNFSTQPAVSYNYNLPGVYNAGVIAQCGTGPISKKWEIIISEVPVANRIPNQVVCGNANTAYYLKVHTPAIMGTQSADTFRVDYFLSESNAIMHENPLPLIYNLPLGVTNFYAKIYNIKNLKCYAITSFDVTLMSQLIAGQVSNYTICENGSGDFIEVFDLSTKNIQVLNGLNSSQFTITYHNSPEAATNDANALPLLYTNTFPQETIYVRLENNNDPTCYATTSFIIRVIEQPVVGNISSFLECDDALGTGIATFDLSQKTAEILGTLSPDIYSVSYYLSQFEANNDFNAITSPYTNTSNNQTIYVAIKSIGNACKATGSFSLIVASKPKRFRLKNIKICDDIANDGKEVFSFSSQTFLMLNDQIPGQFVVSYHLSSEDAQNDADPLPLNYQNVSNPQTIYTRIENVINPNCFEVGFFEIQVDYLPFAYKPDTINLCSDKAGWYSADIDLHLQDSVILGNQSNVDFKVSYYTSFENASIGMNPLTGSYQNTASSQQLFARVDNVKDSKCFAITDFEVNVFPKPILEMQDVYSYCKTSNVVITAPAGFDTYEWSTGATTQSIVITTPMDVVLSVTKNYGAISCSNTAEFTVVESSVAIIKEVQIYDWTESQNSIHIITYGNGDYEYSINGLDYQDSPYFYGLEMGEHTVYVKDKNECGIVTKDIYLLIYPKYFTPNGDGHNEKWQIRFADSEPNLEVSIFDKYGKLITSFDGKSDGWDGTYNNNVLPSADYWFVVKRKNGIAYRGHFALFR